jgi:FkbM family methyltransferase
MLRRLRYAVATVRGSNILANEKIGVPWQRDWQVVRVVKRVEADPPQKRRTDSAGRELWHTAAGDFWTPPGVSERFVRMITIEALSDIYHFAAQIWKHAPVVLDCGANVGIFSRMALDLGAGKVVCCEPSPEAAACLRLTFAAEIQEGRLAVVQKALWDKTETLEFSITSRTNPGTHRVVTESQPDTISVEATTVDRIVTELTLPRVDFIKMDIEGAECRALRGATTTVKNSRPLIGMGTEHTKDIAANNELLIKTLREIEPSYRVLCTEVHPEQSPSRGLVLTPYSLFFY